MKSPTLKMVDAEGQTIAQSGDSGSSAPKRAGANIPGEAAAPQVTPSDATPAALPATTPLATRQTQLAYTAAELAIRADALSDWTRAPNTRKGYKFDWIHFTAWCKAHDLSPLPAESETVRLYLAAHGMPGKGMLTAATLARRLAAITAEHRKAHLEPPTHTDAIRKVMTGIRRAQAEEGIVPKKATPMRTDTLRQVTLRLPTDPPDLLPTDVPALWPVRNRAMLTMGFALGCRPGELVAFNLSDIELIDGKGLMCLIRRSKTDQEGKGRKVAIKYGSDPRVCPVVAYLAWVALLKDHGIERGPVFRPIDRHKHIGEKRLSTNAVAEIVKICVVRGGLERGRFTGRSLRRGLVTSAVEARVDRKVIARSTGHVDMETLEMYVGESENLFDETAASAAGL